MANISRPWLANTAKTAAGVDKLSGRICMVAHFLKDWTKQLERYSPKYKKTNIIIVNLHKYMAPC